MSQVIHQSRGPEKTKPRRENMRRVLVRFRDGASQTVIAGTLLRKSDAGPEGTVELTAYESDIPRILALIEDDTSGLKRARESHLRTLRKHLAENTPWSLDAIPEDPAEWDEDLRRVEQVYGGSSTESKFFEMTGRGIKPLVDVQVEDEVLPPPLGEHEESVAAVARQFAGGGMDAATLATAFAEALKAVGLVPQAEPTKRTK